MFVCLLELSECPTDGFEFEYHQQTLAKLPSNATEIKRFLKYVRNLGFLETDGFFSKNLIFFKIDKVGPICCRMRIKFFACLFSTKIDVYLKEMFKK